MGLGKEGRKKEKKSLIIFIFLSIFPQGNETGLWKMFYAWSIQGVCKD
jgi:hypothetical protein